MQFMRFKTGKATFMLALRCMTAIRAAGQEQYTVDTAFHADTGCAQKIYAFWYLKGKYPESSRRLAAQADEVIPDVARTGLKDGFINLQFLVSCNGITTAYRLSQTDQQYHPVNNPAEAVNALYRFVQSLKQWKPGVYEGKPVYYRAYFAFKIRKGHVVEVSP